MYIHFSYFVQQPLPNVASADEKAYCVGHRQKEIIDNQKEALLELRARVRVLEQQGGTEKGK